MDKIKIDPKTYLYPMPTILLGSSVKGKPSYNTIAYCGIVSHNPPAISAASNKRHYTNIGIRENKTFSINIPSADMVKVTDYCGIVSGHDVDKSVLFDSFYGELETAPMIMECPLNLECRLVETVTLLNWEAFIGEIAAVYTSEEYMTDGLLDITKIDPIIFAMHEYNYYRLGDLLAKAHSVGKDYKK